MEEATVRFCKNCKEKLYGRIDKKFCNDHCRNNYNNHKARIDLAQQRKIDSILHRNHKILLNLLKHNKAKVHKEELLIQGFNFHFFTGLLRENSTVYKMCYDIVYNEGNENYIEIAQRGAD